MYYILYISLVIKEEVKNRNKEIGEERRVGELKK
jgi:hypothetical protein